MSVALNVCVTCRAGQTIGADEPCAGQLLHGALVSEALPPGIDIIPVKCLSACSRGAAVAVASKGRWSYVYGHLSAVDAAEIVRGVKAYAGTADGIVPWKERVDIFKKNVLARIPPFREV